MARCNWIHEIKKPFRLRPTVISHGWYELPPLEWDEAEHALYIVERMGAEVYLLRVVEKAVERGRVILEVESSGPKKTKAVRQELERRVARILRLDADLSGFYKICRKTPTLNKVPRMGAGRIIRGSDLFADLVKGICGTNVAWKQAVRMVHRLANLGPVHPDRPGLHAFPTPAEIREAGVEFLVDTVRLGYRASYVLTLASEAESGAFSITELEAMEATASADDLVKAYTRVKGVGKTTANYLLSLAGHYDRMAIDSAVINYCGEHHFDGRKPSPKEVEALYESYGEWKALAWWFEGWQYYIERNPPGKP